MTKAELQKRAHTLNGTVTFALASLEALTETMPEGSKAREVCRILAQETRNLAGDAWIDGETA